MLLCTQNSHQLCVRCVYIIQLSLHFSLIYFAHLLLHNNHSALQVPSHKCHLSRLDCIFIFMGLFGAGRGAGENLDARLSQEIKSRSLKVKGAVSTRCALGHQVWCCLWFYTLLRAISRCMGNFFFEIICATFHLNCKIG